MVMSKKKPWSTSIRTGTLVQVETADGVPIRGIVIRTGAKKDGLYVQYLNSKGDLETLSLNDVADPIQISGYRGTEGLLRYTAEQGLDTFKLTWNRLPRNTALKIAIRHIEADYYSLFGNDQLFCMDGAHGSPEERADFFVELYGRLVKRSDLLGKVSRGSDQGVKRSLNGTIGPTFKEALACFQAHPTPAMADLILEVFMDDIIKGTLDHPDPLVILEVFRGAANPYNPYRREIDSPNEWIARVLGDCLYFLPSTTLRALKKNSDSALKTRVKDLLQGVPKTILKAAGQQYDMFRGDQKNIPPFNRLDILP